MKDVRHILKLRIGWGILIYLAIVAPWYVAVSLKGGYAHGLIIVTNFTRYLKEWAHVRPFYYYLGTTPPYFLPWFFFLPAADSRRDSRVDRPPLRTSSLQPSRIRGSACVGQQTTIIFLAFNF